jgi:ABC-2 type transport system ATP-binding protein
MTVRQLLDYCRPFYPTWDRDLEARLLRQFDLPAERRLKHLSRGMLMKAALLSSLAYRPKLLVLDEPFSGLDPVVRDDFIRGVLEVSATGDWTVLVSSHDIEEVERLADHVAMLDAGRLRLSERTESLQARFRRVEVTNAAAATSALPDCFEWERAGALTRFVATRYVPGESEREWSARLGPSAVRVQPMSLREIFMTLARTARATNQEASA